MKFLFTFRFIYSDVHLISTDIDRNFLFHQFIMTGENYKSFSLAFYTSKTDWYWLGSRKTFTKYHK